jgi:hypothetical protein
VVPVLGGGPSVGRVASFSAVSVLADEAISLRRTSVMIDQIRGV